jgi:hypothetical protein
MNSNSKFEKKNQSIIKREKKNTKNKMKKSVKFKNFKLETLSLSPFYNEF